MPKLRAVAPFAIDDDVMALAEAKLAASGLSMEDAGTLSILALSADETKTREQALWFLPSLEFTYIDPWTGKPMSPRPNWPPMKRYRALREPDPKPKDFPKYLQAPDTGVAAYFPANMDWPEVLSDWRRNIIITEGELKSACACKNGFATIGLGGVWSWRAMKQGDMFLPEFEKIVWARRAVYIIFDSDCRTNPNVVGALQTLAEELMQRGALPYTVVLPTETEGSKTGLDDYIVAHGGKNLIGLLERADQLTIAKPLWDTNEHYAYVRSPPMVVEKRTGNLVKPEAFRSHVTTKRYAAGKLLPNGTLVREMVSAGEGWLQWAFREEVARMAYVPGDTPRAVVEKDGERIYNTWPGWACQPKKGSVKLFLRLVDHLFTGAEPVAKQYFLQWLAYPIVHPGVKLLSSAVIHGREQGTGKSLLGVTMSKIYGDNYTAVTQDNMAGSFNHWAAGRQFIMLDDVTSSDKRRDLDRLKVLITQEKIWINTKHVPEYCVDDCITYLFSSNHQDVLLLEKMDRRFFIHEVKVKPRADEFYAEYDAWVHGPDAGPALFHYFLNDVDLTGFNPNAAPPVTEAKRKMISLAQTDLDAWIDDALENPSDFLKIGDVPMKADLLTLAEVRACYTAFAGREPDISQIGLARKLASHGVLCVNNGRNMYVTGRPLARYFVMRNAERWAKASVDQMKRHLGEIFAASRMRI